MSDTTDELLGLFPLDAVLVPEEVIPLHIFEDRYKKLIGERLEGGAFGIVLVDDDRLRGCGCTARVVELIERFDDGRMNVLVQGERRFRLVELREPEDAEADYLRAGVEYYGDDDEEEAAEALRAGVLETLRRMLVLMGVEKPREPAKEGQLSFRVAAAVDFGTPLKQELLESASEKRRLEMLLTVMTALVPRLELRKQREEAIRGNGKGY